ncbi:Arachidonate 5-lipoxygenase [Datura stramonium]|uniref:Arachidonate 5-lipoxygenase n=1 Tax=Datura stramonium TaxID=4076 RepID=A0ABS8RIF7_DATST|nr:Arachidonate 5-lipoxygenase [Datura stramonium]
MAYTAVKFLCKIIKSTLLGSGSSELAGHGSHEIIEQFTFVDGDPGHGRVCFICNSWIYPSEYYKKDRIFFSNQTYLPSQTPAPLCYYREEERKPERKWYRWRSGQVYDYDVYNDFVILIRVQKILKESRLPLLKSLDIYVPRDERFNQLKMSDFAYALLKLLAQFFRAELEAASFTEFDTFEDEMKIYDDVV